MIARQRAFNLIANELNLPINSPLLPDALYLVKALGIELYINYGWYGSSNRGSILLSESIAHELTPINTDGMTLASDVVRACNTVNEIIGSRPSDLPPVTWLSLLKTYHWLRIVSRMSHIAALEYVSYHRYLPDVQDVLNRYDLL